MEIDYNSKGKWSADAVKDRYMYLRSYFGGAEGFKLEPRTHTNKSGFTWIYNIMDAVADGVQLGDNACIELSIEYIEENVMGSTTGYIRERMARSLRHAELTSDQKKRLAEVFITQLKSGNLHKEFKEYTRLFKTIGIESYRSEIEEYTTSSKKYVQRAVQRLLA